jgi:uncharacterized coiled-coil protein SlyX
LRLGLPRLQAIWIIRGFLLIPLALAWFALSPTSLAQLPSPTPDGGYPGENTAEGDSSLTANGVRNTAVGFEALASNTGGGANTAIGASALASNTANDNTACGSYALANNTTGSGNTAIGIDVLMLNTTGGLNTATGRDALFNNTIGGNNTATGNDALFSNTTGFQNTATGSQALQGNTTGYRNTADGDAALFTNITGINNTANGNFALYHNTGSNNIGLGYGAGSNLTAGSGNVCIGAGVFGVAGENNTTRIRNVYSSVASGRAVYINSDNKIGTLVSSRRFKDEIKSMDKASEAILALKPVTFRYKKEIEPNGALMFGLIAEDVEKVDPSLVTRNDKGEVEAVRYDAVNAMLLNEFLKEHREVQDQKATITQLKSTVAQQQTEVRALSQLKSTIAKQDATIAKQQKQIETLTAGLERVNAQVEVNKPAPQMANNDP